MILFGKPREYWTDPPEEMECLDEAERKDLSRYVDGMKAFYETMMRFNETDLEFPAKEAIIYGNVQRGVFVKTPPEEWADLTKSLYLSITAFRN